MGREHCPSILLQEAINNTISCRTAGFQGNLDKLISSSCNHYYWHHAVPLGTRDCTFCCISIPTSAHQKVLTCQWRLQTRLPALRTRSSNYQTCSKMWEKAKPFPLLLKMPHAGTTQTSRYLKTALIALEVKGPIRMKLHMGGCIENSKANTTIRPGTEILFFFNIFFFCSSEWSLRAGRPARMLTGLWAYWLCTRTMQFKEVVI